MLEFRKRKHKATFSFSPSNPLAQSSHAKLFAQKQKNQEKYKRVKENILKQIQH